jgi:hypothetical protein
MNAEKALAAKLAKPDLCVITGSRLYGTARYDENGNCLSDTDKRGVVVPPWEYLTVRTFEQQAMEGEADGLLFSVGFFVKQLIACNPQHLELLFVPETHVLECSDLGRELLAMKDAFVCKRFYKRIFGFGNSEWRKARMVELESNERTKTEDEVINDIRNVFGPTFGEQQKEKMDELLSILFSCHPRKEKPSEDKVTGKRKAEFEKYGYGTSSACHSLRLVRQCAELLRTGNMTFPRPDAQQLSDIKHGRLKLEEVEALYNESMLDAEAAVKETSLPERPDVGRIQEWYEKLVAKALAFDGRLQLAAR